MNFEIKINFTFDLRYTNVKALSFYKCDRYKRVSWKYITTFVTTFRFLFLHEWFFSYPHFVQMYDFILLNGIQVSKLPVKGEILRNFCIFHAFSFHWAREYINTLVAIEEDNFVRILSEMWYLLFFFFRKCNKFPTSVTRAIYKSRIKAGKYLSIVEQTN